MAVLDTLTERNKEFAAHRAATLPIMPSLRTLIVTCADPRVDPAHIVGLELGEALVIRNIGGRIVPSTLQAMALLQAIAQADGVTPGNGFNLIVLHHTDCGITRLAAKPAILAGYFGVGADALTAKAVGDPRAAVAADVAALKANPAIPDAWAVAGLVYDVRTGLVETVVAPASLQDGRGIA